jgi:N-acetylmuramoyl-L-alanine amidase
MKIAIMPGHVGKDSGAIDATGSGDELYSVEAVITQSIASKACMFGGLLGMQCLEAIGSFKNRILSTSDCGAGVEVHADICNDERIRGYHAIYSPGSTAGKSLAEALDRALGLTGQHIRAPHEDDRGLFILKHTAYPCVVLECGFLSNPAEEKILNNDVDLYNIAFQIIVGIREWLYRK